MKSINIVECKNEDDLKEVAILAEKIWHEFFPGIISEAQIDYMVEQFQSFDAMQDQVKHQQYHYHKVYEGDELVGYIGLQNQPDRLFLFVPMFFSIFAPDFNTQEGYNIL